MPVSTDGGSRCRLRVPGSRRDRQEVQAGVGIRPCQKVELNEDLLIQCYKKIKFAVEPRKLASALEAEWIKQGQEPMADRRNLLARAKLRELKEQLHQTHLVDNAVGPVAVHPIDNAVGLAAELRLVDKVVDLTEPRPVDKEIGGPVCKLAVDVPVDLSEKPDVCTGRPKLKLKPRTLKPQEDAISSYTTTGYHSINSALRSPSTASQAASDRARVVVDVVSSRDDPLLSYERGSSRLYRAMNDYFHEYEEYGILSTGEGASLERPVLYIFPQQLQYSQNGFKIHLAKGASPASKAECEVVFPPPTYVKVRETYTANSHPQDFKKSLLPAIRLSETWEDIVKRMAPSNFVRHHAMIQRVCIAQLGHEEANMQELMVASASKCGPDMKDAREICAEGNASMEQGSKEEGHFTDHAEISTESNATAIESARKYARFPLRATGTIKAYISCPDIKEFGDQVFMLNHLQEGIFKIGDKVVFTPYLDSKGRAKSRSLASPSECPDNKKRRVMDGAYAHQSVRQYLAQAAHDLEREGVVQGGLVRH
jgi:hypothetical protein